MSMTDFVWGCRIASDVGLYSEVVEVVFVAVMAATLFQDTDGEGILCFN